jgi:hypothetical protein
MVASSAPRSRNRGSIVRNPGMINNATTSNARRMLWNIRFLVSSMLALPIALDTIAEVPMPIPMEILPINMATGKVKPMAARGKVPSFDTNHASTRLKAITESMPKTMGMVIFTSIF